jgi:hypothetical protein
MLSKRPPPTSLRRAPERTALQSRFGVYEAGAPEVLIRSFVGLDEAAAYASSLTDGKTYFVRTDHRIVWPPGFKPG